MAPRRGKGRRARRIVVIVGAPAGLIGIVACCLFALGFVTGTGDLSTLTSGFRSGPFRRHTTVSVGTGTFEQATQSDGMAPFAQSTLDAEHPQVHRIRPEENPDGCDRARFRSRYIWFTGPSGMALTVNDHEIGRLSAAGGSHGYMVAWRIASGDKLCAETDKPGGFYIVAGPDVYYHYDSYCYRGHCE